MINDNRDFLKSQGTKGPNGSATRRPDIVCPQCGAGITSAPGRALRICPFCESTLSVTQDQPVREWLIRPVLSRTECYRLLSAWLWETYRGAASCPEFTGQQWIAWRHAPARGKSGTMSWRAELSDPGRYPELRGMKLPYGEHRPLSDDAASGFDLGERQELADDESHVVYLPVYVARFRIGQGSERAIIESANGTVRGALPARLDISLRRWTSFGIAALVLLLEAFLIRNLTARLVVTGLTFAAAEVALGLVWEGLLWRR
jgi:hypothetical protein